MTTPSQPVSSPPKTPPTPSDDYVWCSDPHCFCPDHRHVAPPETTAPTATELADFFDDESCEPITPTQMVALARQQSEDAKLLNRTFTFAAHGMSLTLLGREWLCWLSNAESAQPVASSATPATYPRNRTEPHPEDFCERCGRENVTWFAPSELWNRAARVDGNDPMLCPVCFIKAAEAVGIVPPSWQVAPEAFPASSATPTPEPLSLEQAEPMIARVAASSQSLAAALASSQQEVATLTEEVRRLRAESHIAGVKLALTSEPR